MILIKNAPRPYCTWSLNYLYPQVSTHGYSQNQILVWKYPSLVQVAKLTGHSYRVLYLAMSPDGEAIVTGAGDETLRFWNVFSKARSQKVSSNSGCGGAALSTEFVCLSGHPTV